MPFAHTISNCQVEQSILQALLYFEIFSYPLTDNEIIAFMAIPAVSDAKFDQHLKNLVTQGFVFRFGSFYTTQNQPEWVEKRIENNQRADLFLPKAYKWAQFIGKFPFIRGVFVSGSLSKHCMSADSDIDFFLITSPKRLWLSRTLLVVFKKIFLFNSHKYFCVNYFVDTEHLTIEEQNLFTAVETVTLLPLYGREWYGQFREENQWALQHFPNYASRLSADIPVGKSSWVKKGLEWLLSGWLGERLDIWAMHMTVGFWKRKFKGMDKGTFDVALKSKRHVSKHHPLFFQRKVLIAFAGKWEKMQMRISNKWN